MDNKVRRQTRQIRYIGKTKPKKFNLLDIEELKFIVIITTPTKETDLIKRLEELGGRVLFREIAEGIAKNKKLELLGIETTNSIVIFACARKEDADNILVAVDAELNFSLPGMGLGFTLDLDGYMGAKGLFV